jgi:hypothetical protein
MSYRRSLREAIRTAATLERYIQNIRDSATEQPNLNSRGPRSRTRQVAVVPFSFDMPANTFALVTTTDRSWTAMSAALTNFADDTIGSLDVQKVSGLTPAKILYFQAASRSVSIETSERTGLRYLKYAGNNYSAPFGRGTDGTQDQYDVFTEIRNELLPSGYTGIRRVSHSVERMRAR